LKRVRGDSTPYLKSPGVLMDALNCPRIFENPVPDTGSPRDSFGHGGLGNSSDFARLFASVENMPFVVGSYLDHPVRNYARLRPSDVARGDGRAHFENLSGPATTSQSSSNHVNGFSMRVIDGGNS
jgi:hypothetical protein